MRRLAGDARALLEFLARMPGMSGMAWVMAGLLAGWWIYVPIHELLHVAGLVLTGGTITRLELDAIYGAHLLARIFDFVHPASEYAGQLTGFNTNGSDVTYLSCVLMPYAITVFPGFWLWRLCLDAEGTPGPGRMLAAGALLPVTLAPILSIPGDYYEAGSILVSRVLAPAIDIDIERWRHDDVFRLIGERSGTTEPLADTLGIGASLVLGIALAVATVWLASILAARLRGAGSSQQGESP